MSNTASFYVNPFNYIGVKVMHWLENSPDKKGWYRTKVTLTFELPDKLFGREAAGSSKCGKVSLTNGLLHIEAGWDFDGASGPAIDGVRNMLSALIHDALYLLKEHGCSGFSYGNADTMYRKIMIAQMPGKSKVSLLAGKTRAWYHYVILRGCGWFYRIFN